MSVYRAQTTTNNQNRLCNSEVWVGKGSFLSIFLYSSYFLQWLPVGLLLYHTTTPNPRSILSCYSPPWAPLKYSLQPFQRCWPFLDLAFSSSSHSTCLIFCTLVPWDSYHLLHGFLYKTELLRRLLGGISDFLGRLPLFFLTQGSRYFHEQPYILESVATGLHLHFCLIVWNSFFSNHLSKIPYIRL